MNDLRTTSTSTNLNKSKGSIIQTAQEPDYLVNFHSTYVPYQQQILLKEIVLCKYVLNR